MKVTPCSCESQLLGELWRDSLMREDCSQTSYHVVIDYIEVVVL